MRCVVNGSWDAHDSFNCKGAFPLQDMYLNKIKTKTERLALRILVNIDVIV
ncbi:Hypothetical protein FKW44_007262, partial [Caligus rogercresseyi]